MPQTESLGVFEIFKHSNYSSIVILIRNSFYERHQGGYSWNERTELLKEMYAECYRKLSLLASCITVTISDDPEVKL